MPPVVEQTVQAAVEVKEAAVEVGQAVIEATQTVVEDLQQAKDAVETASTSRPVVESAVIPGQFGESAFDPAGGIAPPPPQPPAPPPDTGENGAEAAHVRELRERNAARAARAATPDAEPVFDPVFEAKKRKEKKDRKAEIDAAYKDLYGDDKGGIMDALLGKGGMLGGAIQAAGAAALPALAIKEMLKQVNAAVIGSTKAVIGGASGIANFAADANADPAAHIKSFGDATSKAGEQIADKLSPALGWMTVAAGESAAALGSFMAAVNKTAERYGEFSAEISGAQAMAEITQTMGDMRRAQEIGPEIANFLMAQSDLQQKFEDAKIKILAKILPLATRGVELLELIMPSGNTVGAAIDGLSGALVGMIGSHLAAPLMGILKAMEEQRYREVADPTDALFLDSSDRNSMQVPKV